MISLKRRLFNRSMADSNFTEKVKIIFQYVLMLVFSVIMGILSIKLLPDGYENEALIHISKHFDLLFTNCHSFSQTILNVLSYSVFDLVVTAVVMLSAFTVFNYAASDVAIVCEGFKFGFCTAFLSRFISGNVTETVYRLGFIRYFIFVFFKAVIASLLIWFAYRVSVISFRLKKYTPVGRTLINPRELVGLILLYATFSGLIIILNGIYCLLIFLLK